MPRLLKFPGKSFQLRLFFSFLIIIFCFIPSFGYLSFLEGKRAVENQIEQYSLSTVNQISERVRFFLLQHSRNVRFIKELLEKKIIDPEDQEQLLSYFRRLRKTYPSFVNIYYGTCTGKFLMVPPQRPEIHKLFDPRIRPWYQGAKNAGKLFWTKVYIFASSQRPGITVSIPVYGENRKLIGVCGIDIDLSTLSNFLKNINVGKHGYPFIIENSTERIIAHPELVKFSQGLDEIARLSLRLKTLKKRNQKFGTTYYFGERFFTAYTYFPQNDWTIGVTLPVNDFLTDIAKIKQAALTMTIIAILIASLLSLLIARTVVRPLTELEKGIKRISAGNLEQRISMESDDVIGSLARSFNQMAESLKLSHQELEKTYMELAEKEKMAALGQLTAGIAHEIKNPLGIILSSAQVAMNEARPEEMRSEAMEFIVQEVKRLNKTLNTFLEFAKPAPPRFEKIDIVELMKDTVNALADQFRDQEIKIYRRLPDSKVFCEVDRDQIRQVFLNLLINSAQAMPDGGMIEVTGYFSDDLYNKTESGNRNETSIFCIEITDTGTGIDSQLLKKIFDPFVTTKTDGTGLGLSIVHQILKQHRAKIDVENSTPKGTRFRIMFRCERKKPCYQES